VKFVNVGGADAIVAIARNVEAALDDDVVESQAVSREDEPHAEPDLASGGVPDGGPDADSGTERGDSGEEQPE
jgi:hypothetical protein